MTLPIVFMGTPEFAVPSLKILLENNFPVVAVVTSPDKPAGRGLHLNISPVKKFAIENKLKILQPDKLKDVAFLNELYLLKPALQVVVAFRMLPEEVWRFPINGTINLHASLLPDYRGAAPINWAIINGEKETGITTFFIKQEIDTGDIIFQEKILIDDQLTAGELHDILMIRGAELILKTVKTIENKTFQSIPQLNFSKKEIKPAPKIFKHHCEINWNKSAKDVNNFIRGLSPYPGAWFFHLNKIFKIYKSEVSSIPVSEHKQKIFTDNNKFLYFACSDFFISIKELQMEGKKRMNIEEFLRGNLGFWI